ncbi:quaternary ammonium compound-resistance protein SugE [Legionella taurinensis]|uniref:Guanidinium exporter n=2 Tax=Legionella taurinensis TaxID=70611 RepID=A0A3A5L7T9_9GAMM|nr:quaternary ammonium compound-resistance protein SugE [Legionella taurinensis]PUT44669.1 quaternary ammonium compound-resistance protein SugE [Legionella taurinensis]PUT47989.1 quaternary ammonium compound-resistance protein SugE [Legionella taurinensis]PUT49101.1 quaternary ammonium compound-resistance protein SugE [Legionella taurinensis]RJT45972.1 quaternary ammonium compound-resistance protein SugE [Legionella taurinensis]
MAWIALFLAGFFEIFWAICLKYTEGFSRLYPSLLTGAGMAVSFFFLSYALKSLPLGTAYAVWTGIGSVGTVIYGIYFFGESTSLLRLTCISLICLSIIGLNLSEK